MSTLLSDYDYLLPESQIALYPSPERSGSRLLHVDRISGKFENAHFYELKKYLKPGDVLVLNDTKVIPARLIGKRSSGGKVTALLVKKNPESWETLLKPGGKIKKKDILEFGENGIRLKAQVLDDPRADTGMRTLSFESPDFEAIIEKIGHTPLPPYIPREDESSDRERYQTVFARHRGAVAAPTAGLHFEKTQIEELRQCGIEIVTVTLHVSYGTFQPIHAEDVRDYPISEEEFIISNETAEILNLALKEKRRIIACGTTSVRTLESAVDAEGKIQAQQGRTRLFIYPPYTFKVVGGMITNFHLPKSSLLLLVSAFLGREKMLQIYRYAVEQNFRFFSYGDAMLIL